MSTLDYFSCPLSALNRANESSKAGKLQQSCKASVQVKIINPSSPTLLTVMAINSKLMTSRSEFWINILQNLLMWILSHNRCSRNRWVKIIHTRQRRSTSADWIGSFGSIDTVKALMCSQIHSFFVGLHQKVSLGYTYFTPYISISQHHLLSIVNEPTLDAAAAFSYMSSNLVKRVAKRISYIDSRPSREKLPGPGLPWEELGWTGLTE